jgi:hypothetical protein
MIHVARCYDSSSPVCVSPPGWAGLGWAGLGWAGLAWCAVRRVTPRACVPACSSASHWAAVAVSSPASSLRGSSGSGVVWQAVGAHDAAVFRVCLASTVCVWCAPQAFCRGVRHDIRTANCAAVFVFSLRACLSNQALRANAAVPGCWRLCFESHCVCVFVDGQAHLLGSGLEPQ